MKEHLARQIRTYLSDHKKRRRLIRVLFTLSVITAVSVYASLLRPAISAESQGIKITSETVTETAGNALTAKISAKAENGQDQTTFLIMTKSTGAGLSSEYIFTNNVTEIVSDSGTSLSLHRVLEKDGELAYWFTLNKGSSESFALNFASGQKASDASSAAAESAASDTTNTVTAATTTSTSADSSVTETSADQTITLSGYTGVTYEAAQTAADQDSASSTDTVVSGNTAVTLSWTEDSSSSTSTASAAKTATTATASAATTDSDSSDTASLSASETASDSAVDTTTDTAADTESLLALSVLSASSANATAPTGYSSSLTYKQISSDSDTFTNTNYYLSNRYLGIAGNFHIVAFNTATLNTHTNGNVLANNLYAKTNFGTNNLEDELSYVQNYKQVNSVSASNDSHVLVLGSDNTVGTADNGSHFTVAGTKLDRPLNVWQDANTANLPFIDLTAVKTSVTGISNTLSAMSAANLNTNMLSAGAGSVDASYVTLTDSKATGVYNTTAAKLQSYSYFGIKGFTSTGTGAVIVNVDCSGVKSVTLPSSTIYVDDKALSFGEKKDFTEGGVIFNFTNCSGVTINTNLLYATILAPGATVNVNQNLNGSVIADNVNINAESHRDDFVKLQKPTTTTASVKAVKIWEYSDGTEMSDTDKAAAGDATVQLYNGTTAVGNAVTLNSENNWTNTWSNLDTTGSYSVQETAVDGYTTSYSATGIASGEIRVVNKKNTTTTTSTKTHVDVTKSWSDGKDSHTDGSVTVYLCADNAISTDSSGNPITLTLNNANNWSGSFTDLPYYHEDGSTVINYTVKEGAVDGYTASYSDPVVTTASSTETFAPASSAAGASNVIVIKNAAGTMALTLTLSNGTYALSEENYDANNKAQHWTATNTGTNGSYGMGFTLTNVQYSDQMLHFNDSHGVNLEYFDTVATGSITTGDSHITFYYNSQTVNGNTMTGIYALNKYNGKWYHKYISSAGVLTIAEISSVPPVVNVNRITFYSSIKVTNTKDSKTSVTAKKIWGSNTTSAPVTVTLYRSTTDSYSDSSGGSSSDVTHTVSFTNGSSKGSAPKFTVKDGSTLYITMSNDVWGGYLSPPDNATYSMGTASGSVTVTPGDSYGTEIYEIDHITADTTITLPDVNSWWWGSTSEYPFGVWTISSKEIAGTSAAVTGKQVDTPSGATLIYSAVLNVDNDWSYTWSDLPMDDGKVNYYYYIVETVPNGSIATYKYTMDASTGTMSTTTITNTGTFKLPEAGGSGTFVVYLTVVLLMALSAGIYMKRHAEKGGLG